MTRRRAAGDGAGRGPAAPLRARRPTGAAAVGRPPGAARPRRFIRESIGELQKVDWPNRAQVIQGTIVVLIACAIVGAFLWGADQILRPFVREVLLGQ